MLSVCIVFFFTHRLNVDWFIIYIIIGVTHLCPICNRRTINVLDDDDDDDYLITLFYACSCFLYRPTVGPYT